MVLSPCGFSIRLCQLIVCRSRSATSPSPPQVVFGGRPSDLPLPFMDPGYHMVASSILVHTSHVSHPFESSVSYSVPISRPLSERQLLDENCGRERGVKTPCFSSVMPRLPCISMPTAYLLKVQIALNLNNSFIHTRHLYSASSSETTQKRSQP